MVSTYTANGGIEKIGSGEQSGTWGTTTNTNFDIIDRLTNGVGAITLSGTTHTLTTSEGTLSDGMFKTLVLGGSPSGTNTITISPNTADKLYFVKNASGQSVIFSQGSGANVTVANGEGAIIFADGAGSGAAVTDLTTLFPNANTSGAGTFASLTVDNVIVNGSNIGHTDDTDLITVANGVVTVAGEVSATTLDIGGTNITSTAAELNILDGVTATTSELNIMDGVTATTAELNIMDGVTATAAELNIMDGVTATAAELNHTDGVTSNIQTQINTIVPSGVLMPYGGSSAPTGFLLCDGSAVSRSTYSDLFSAISTTYGAGNGSSTFNIPDLRGRVIAGQDDMGGSSANRLTNQSGGLNGDTLGATGGAETHTLTTAQLPAHTHTVSAQAQVVGDSTNRGGSGQLGAASTITTSSVGSGSAHNNVQPTIILNYIIKT